MEECLHEAAREIVDMPIITPEEEPGYGYFTVMWCDACLKVLERIEKTEHNGG
jgi:hypothetical protein